MYTNNTNTNNSFVDSAFKSLFDESAPYKMPWEKSGLTYEEWHRLYVKALNDVVELSKYLASVSVEDPRELCELDADELLF